MIPNEPLDLYVTPNNSEWPPGEPIHLFMTSKCGQKGLHSASQVPALGASVRKRYSPVVTSLPPPCPPGALSGFQQLPESQSSSPVFQILLLSVRSLLAYPPSPPRVPGDHGDFLSPSAPDCEPHVDRLLVNPFLTPGSPAPCTVLLTFIEWAWRPETVTKGQPRNPWARGHFPGPPGGTNHLLHPTCSLPAPRSERSW